MSGAIVTPALAADSESTASGAIQPRATHECDSAIGKLLQSGRSTAAPAYAGSVDCWLDYDVQNYNHGTFMLQYYGLIKGEGFHDLDADGYYGAATQSAIIKVQHAHAGLAVDGVYGKLTGSVMWWETITTASPSGSNSRLKSRLYVCKLISWTIAL